MARFRYQAQDETGKRISGIVTALDKAEVYERLKRQNLYPREIKLVKTNLKKQALSLEQTSDFCRELGTMLKAGVPLLRTLTVMSVEEGRTPYIKQLCEDMIKELSKGTALSAAMEEMQAFPALLVHMLKVAEDSGRLSQTLLSMADYYEKEYQNISKMKSAAAYPKLLFGLLVVALFVILGMIVPRFEPLFTSVKELPAATKLLLAVSNAIRAYWELLIVGAAILIIGLKALCSLQAVRFYLDRAKLTAPFWGRQNQVICTERFARTLSTLYSAGLPITSSLQGSARTIGNQYIEHQFGRVIGLVRKGQNLSDAVKTVEGFVPKLAVSIAVGEETGALGSMLTNLAEILSHDAERSMSKKIALVEPALIIIMGIVVLFIMLAVLVPIYQSYAVFM